MTFDFLALSKLKTLVYGIVACKQFIWYFDDIQPQPNEVCYDSLEQHSQKLFVNYWTFRYLKDYASFTNGQFKFNRTLRSLRRRMLIQANRQLEIRSDIGQKTRKKKYISQCWRGWKKYQKTYWPDLFDWKNKNHPI